MAIVFFSPSILHPARDIETNLHSLICKKVSANAVAAMCEKCKGIDERIDRYRGVISKISDQLTIERVQKLIEDLEVEKTALHPERKE